MRWCRRPDPTYGRIDPDIQRAVDEAEPRTLAERVAMENSLQARRDERWEDDSDGPFRPPARRPRPPTSLLRFFDNGGGFGLGASVAWLIRGALDGDPVAIVGSVALGVVSVAVGVWAMTQRERRGDL